MNEHRRSPRLWLAVLVAVHLVLSVVHGTAHNRAHVPLSPTATLFVFIVILTAPIVGVLLMSRAQRLGAWVIAIAMTGSFIFGFLNHFILESPDHVARVASAWQPLFATTAVLLAATEAFTSAIAFRFARIRKAMS